ncbi:helix-turn-helix domain-containing protein [Alienimonas californiensis]|uniref:Helix-turn-helix domain protein n=1 Tax=Alienimonas californiensis TaxID=2527989 RepID=A0A517PAH7_9PLAN|nr:helix-turn-helix domain-containing protein [Alienimonas californiensis]QDT16379.1 Helix-turn-helix domain protein [Alienimonas californiensis]
MPVSPSLADAIASTPPAELASEIVSIKQMVCELVEHARGKAKPLLTVEEVAAEVGRAPYTVRTWINNGRLSATRVHGTGPRGRLLVRREDLEELLADG